MLWVKNRRPGIHGFLLSGLDRVGEVLADSTKTRWFVGNDPLNLDNEQVYQYHWKSILFSIIPPPPEALATTESSHKESNVLLPRCSMHISYPAYMFHVYYCFVQQVQGKIFLVTGSFFFYCPFLFVDILSISPVFDLKLWKFSDSDFGGREDLPYIYVVKPEFFARSLAHSPLDNRFQFWQRLCCQKKIRGEMRRHLSCFFWGRNRRQVWEIVVAKYPIK